MFLWSVTFLKYWLEKKMSNNNSITLIHHPTVALKISGFDKSNYAEFTESGVYLGNIYRKIMPASLTRVAKVIEDNIDYEAKILDIRLAGYDKADTFRTIDWEGYKIEVQRIGEYFDYADEDIINSEWLGLSSHFTFESGVIKDLISHAKKVNPKIKIMVGGADVRVRSQDYLNFGADLAFLGDFNPKDITNFDGKPRIADIYRHPFNELNSPSFHKLDNICDYTDSHDGPTPTGVTAPIGFIYFTRGCPRECDFCESRRTGHESLDIDSSVEMLSNYHKAGIRTVNIVDDNLLLSMRTPKGRENLIAIFGYMREKGFAWEFPNGLEVGLLKNGVVDEELMSTLFSHTVIDDKIIGAYRLYVPVETFDERNHYRKLKPIEDQNRIINFVAELQLPEVDFGIVLPPNATEETFLHIEQGYTQIKKILNHKGKTRARYSVFHLIPIAEFRNMKTKYSVYDFPEGWNFHFPVYDGENFSARELFERKLGVIKKVDPENYFNMAKGQYRYS
jgi:radical SAM superfamily enzyme YgiQ (UPF0313 family)